MLRWFFSGTATLALAVSGLMHGLWTDRWQAPAAVTEAAARLDSLPLELGMWRGEAIKVKPGQAGAGVAGCIQRRYVNRQTGTTVLIALVCGRPGPVSIHTPEVCYGASGYAVGAPRRAQLGPDETAPSLWTADAVRTKATEETHLRLFWGWNSGERWIASTAARREFAGKPVLHKLYVLRELDGVGAPARGEPCEDFLQVLLPALQKALFTPVS